MIPSGDWQNALTPSQNGYNILMTSVSQTQAIQTLRLATANFNEYLPKTMYIIG